jgi:hypothetical protein
VTGWKDSFLARAILYKESDRFIKFWQLELPRVSLKAYRFLAALLSRGQDRLLRQNALSACLPYSPSLNWHVGASLALLVFFAKFQIV